MLRILVKAGKKVHAGILNGQRLLLIILFLPLTLAMFAETVARYVIGKGFFAMEDFIGYTAVWLYFVGAAYATHERTQVKAEITGMFLKNPRTLNIIKAVVAAISVAVAAIMVQWTYKLVAFSIASDFRTPVHQVPFVYFQAGIFVGACLMAVYFFTELMDRIRDALHATSSPPGKEE